MEAKNKNNITMLIGLPGSGKSERAAAAFQGAGAIILNEATVPGSIGDRVEAMATSAKSADVVLDFANLTAASRAPFLARAAEMGAPVAGIYLKTSIEHCQIRLLQRSRGQPPALPATSLFAARKRLEEPVAPEGFASLDIVAVPAPQFPPEEYANKAKAIFFDIDGTIRDTEHLPFKYPTRVEEVKVFPGMRERIEAYRRAGYLIFGISNQSGIATGKVSAAAVEACMAETRRQLGCSDNDDELPITYCPHRPAPITCYCRKPQVGQAMAFIEKHRLCPSACVMVGDQKSDQTMAERLGMKYIDATAFRLSAVQMPDVGS